MSNQDVQIKASSALFTKGSKIFFGIFFLAIFLSIGLTYYTIEVRMAYHSFSADEEVPNPLDVYKSAFHWVIGKVTSR